MAQFKYRVLDYQTGLRPPNLARQDRNEACILYNGGGQTWAGIVETDISNVVTTDPAQHKTGHDDRYDDGEIFVVAVKDATKIKRWSTKYIEEKIRK